MNPHKVAINGIIVMVAIFFNSNFLHNNFFVKGYKVAYMF